ncbi:MAG TPA: hypothetical protein VGM11_09425 [Acidobacteriaceae bacterium]|jgi:hypothetical protein
MHLLDRPLLLFIVAFIVLWIAARVGALFRTRVPLPDDARSDFAIVLGAILTLVGLIIGFTFSMATTRYDLRKSLEEQEANAIGTEYLRVDLLPPQDAAQLKAALRSYTQLRIAFYEAAHGPELDRINAETEQAQERLWALVAAAARQQPTPLAVFASAGMNDVINAQGYTQAAWWNRIPRSAWLLLFLIAILGNLLLGYGAKGKWTVLSIVLPLAIGISFFLIADIDSPRAGIIHVHAVNIGALNGSLKGP